MDRSRLCILDNLLDEYIDECGPKMWQTQVPQTSHRDLQHDWYERRMLRLLQNSQKVYCESGTWIWRLALRIETAYTTGPVPAKPADLYKQLGSPLELLDRAILFNICSKGLSATDVICLALTSCGLMAKLRSTKCSCLQLFGCCSRYCWEKDFGISKNPLIGHMDLMKRLSVQMPSCYQFCYHCLRYRRRYNFENSDEHITKIVCFDCLRLSEEHYFYGDEDPDEDFRWMPSLSTFDFEESRCDFGCEGCEITCSVFNGLDKKIKSYGQRFDDSQTWLFDECVNDEDVDCDDGRNKEE